MNANRAQVYGYLAAITFLSRLIEFYSAYSAQRTTIKVLSDSKGWQAQKKWFFDRIVDRPREYSYPDHDVTLQIEAVTNGLKPQIELKDLVVPSYTPETTQSQAGGTHPPIRRPTKLANLQLDQFGTYDEPLQSIPFPSCKGYLLSNGKHQSGDKTRTLRETIPRQQIKQYMQERHDWDKETFNKVNLDAYAAARRSNQRLERFSTRFAHDRDSNTIQLIDL